MNHTTIERAKFYLLLLLILMSFTQLIILWGYQGQGFSTSFLFDFFSGTKSETTTTINKYIKPYRILVSQGFDDTHWILTDQDKDYASLWQDFKLYLSEKSVSGKFLGKSNYTEDDWGALVVKKSLAFEFKTNISNDMLARFLNLRPEFGNQFAGIYKVVVLPFEDINNNVLFYIYDGESICKYSFPISTNGISRSSYAKMFEDLYQNKSLKKYSLVEEYNMQRGLYRMRPDIPITVGDNQTEKVLCQNYYTPEYLSSVTSNKNSDIGKVLDKVLGKGKNDYDFGIDSSGTIVFKNLDNIYKIYSKDVMKYKYLSSANDSDVVDQGLALEKAVEFINSKKNLVSGVDIRLAAITKGDKPGSVTFAFDYISPEQTPIVFYKYETGDKDDVVTNNAIVITANNKRVLSCLWVLKSFEYAEQSLNVDMSFMNLLDNIFTLYPNLSKENFSIEDVNLCYKPDSNASKTLLRPTWVVETQEQDVYFVPVKEEGGS